MNESQRHRPSRPDRRGAAWGRGRPFEAVDDVAEFDAVETGGLHVIVLDLARALSAEIAMLGVADPCLENVEVLAAAGEAPRRDGLSLSLADGFVGRALAFERAAVAVIDPEDRSLGTPRSGGRVTHAVGAAVRPFDGPIGVLCAGFSTDPPPDSARMLWLVEGYAQIASLCLNDRNALDGILVGGRVDGLTGCLTQTAFLHELHREIARSDRHGAPVSCCFIDLDAFKSVNDRHGHLHGSRVLAKIAAALRTEVRSEDTLGRYGGDEFVLLLPDTDEKAGFELAERLRATITTRIVNLPGEPIDVSIGVAQWQPGSTAEDMLADADAALLGAKAAGGGTVIKARELPQAASIVGAGQKSRLHASGGPRSTGTELVTAREVLDVLADFSRFGPTSLESVAWELDTVPGALAPTWSRAVADGVIERCGTDPVTRERLWRISQRAQDPIATPPGAPADSVDGRS